MKHIILLSAMSLMATAVSAGEMSDTTDNFKQIDSDQNGVISKAEASNSETLAPVFNQVDANQDGMLDTDEFARFELIEKE
jgi:Ca2+-binding EF-hand superfamily protein